MLARWTKSVTGDVRELSEEAVSRCEPTVVLRMVNGAGAGGSVAVCGGRPPAFDEQSKSCRPVLL